ncbi:hypothetical protein GEO21_14085 [Sphingobacterium faecium]|uniref:hypothetical protein n=1 Tax=Sphingobacterium faecium TaxID=34087 RepID=UPI001291E6D3|nr:hypothetical protein [Sphingobacterium faecium]MQP28636.1 hypothetical protein [Sphingobacterium faecium]
MKKVILVLGATNDESGNLSQIATDRLNCVFELCSYNDSCQILCSGGFGGFNPTDLPHATYSKAYLVSKGIPNHFFYLLPFLHIQLMILGRLYQYWRKKNQT